MIASDELLTFEGKSCADTIIYILNDYVNCMDLITLLINYVVGDYSIKFFKSCLGYQSRKCFFNGQRSSELNIWV